MAKLANLREIEVADVLSALPDVELLDVARDVDHSEDELFLVALGFEDRCPWISELLGEARKYKAAQAAYFEYATNQNDNDLNRGRLVRAISSFAGAVRPMSCDSVDYSAELRTLLREITTKAPGAGVTVDVSACSSKLLVTTLTVLLEFDVNLRIVYAEAEVYHPTKEEYDADPDKWTRDEELGLARGVGAVTPSPDHPGSRQDILPEAVIVFPTFKPERARAIIAHVDESLVMRPQERVVWLVGAPHLPEDEWRAQVQRTINQIGSSTPAHEVSTFDYKKAVETLEMVYRPLECKYHVNIAPLGSKLQSVGVVVFWCIRPEASIVFASPREYNAAQYSERCKAVWRIDFGCVSNLRGLLDTVGKLELRQELGAEPATSPVTPGDG